MKTYIPKEKDIERKTYVVDASGKTLGRLATKVASVLIGKGKTCFARDKMVGDQVIVLNAKKVHVTGRKEGQKVYTHYSGYPSGLKSYNLETTREKNPERIIMRAVSRMLPKNALGREMLRRLRVFAEDKHNHQAQQPIAMEI